MGSMGLAEPINFLSFSAKAVDKQPIYAVTAANNKMQVIKLISFIEILKNYPKVARLRWFEPINFELLRRH